MDNQNTPKEATTSTPLERGQRANSFGDRMTSGVDALTASDEA
jgi:hypothetical protein